MPTIFISHSTTNNDQTRIIADTLKQAGYGVWVDFESITDGTRWAREIQDGLDACDAVVVVLSTPARQSEWVEKECLYAFGLNKPVFIALIEDVPLPLYLVNIQYTDCRQDLVERLADLIDAMKQNLKSGDSLTDYVAEDATAAPTEDNFFPYVEQLPQGEAAMLVAQDLYFWAQQVSDEIDFGGRQNPAYHVKIDLGHDQVTVFSIWAYPKTPSTQIAFDYLKNFAPFDQQVQRLKLLKQLNQLLPDGIQFDDSRAERRPSIPLHYLSTAEQLEGFKQIILDLINQLKAHQTNTAE